MNVVFRDKFPHLCNGTTLPLTIFSHTGVACVGDSEAELVINAFRREYEMFPTIDCTPPAVRGRYRPTLPSVARWLILRISITSQLQQSLPLTTLTPRLR